MSTKTQIDDAFNYLWNLALAIGIAIFIYLTLQLLTNSENFIQKNTILLYSFLVLMGTGVMSLTIMKLAEEEMETLKKNLKEFNFKLVDIVLTFLWSLAAISAILLLRHLDNSSADTGIFKTTNITILSAFFMLLAASIASASVMKSIAANKELKDRDIANEHKYQLDFMLHICQQSLLSLIYLHNNKSNIGQLVYIINKINSITISWEKLFVDKYFLFINDDTSDVFYGIHVNIGVLATTSNFIESQVLEEFKQKALESEPYTNTIKKLLTGITTLESSLKIQREKLKNGA